MGTSVLAPDNHLFALARRGRRLTHGLLAAVVALPFATVPASLLALPVFLLLRGLGPSANASPLISAVGFVLLLVAAFLPVILVVGLWVTRYEGRPVWTLGLEPGRALRHYARGALAGLLLFGAAIAIMAVLGFTAPERGDPAQASALGGVMLVAVGWAIQGAAEEILCRGWLLPAVGARHGPWLGLLVSSLVFAALHALNPNVGLLALGNLFLFGLFTALYALGEGGLWGVCALHAVWNWAQGNLFGFEVSGSAVPGGILVDLMETGPDEITGGPFGPEGGLAVTAVLLLGIALLLVLPRPATRRARET